MRKLLRDLGIKIGTLPIGEKNSITDIKGVKVGHVTLKKELPNKERITTGVTAILPHDGNLFYEKVPAASFVLNGFGKTIGLVQMEELGLLESPIMLTNTFSIPAVAEGTLKYMLEENKDIGDKVGTINLIVGECNDSYLNDIRGLHVRPKHAIDAINNASSNKVEQGAVGAGTGMSCFGWKGGIGSSSRIIETEEGKYTVGALVLSNFGSPQELVIAGNYIGRELKPNLTRKPDDGSIMVIIGTDAPLNDRQLKRLAKRGALGLARTGAVAHHGSGDIMIAFSNGNKIPQKNTTEIINMPVIAEDGLVISRMFQGVVEAVEESVLNSIFAAETTVGRLDRKREGIPTEGVLNLLK